MTKLSSVNFNLLKSLSALLMQKSVRGAADEMCITPSAMSLNLKQLRELFDDELLVRGQAGKMHLTKRAKALAPEVHATLSQLEVLFCGRQPFDPASLQTEVRLGVSPYAASVVLPALLSKIRREAPGLRIVVKSLWDISGIQPFVDRDIDIGLTYFDIDLQNVHKRTLFSDEGVVLASKSHKIWKQFDGSLKSIRDCEVVVFTGRTRVLLHPHLVYLEKRLSDSCQVNLIVSDPLVAIQAAAENNLVTFSGRRFSEPLLKRYHLAAEPIRSKPFPDTSLYWHEISHNDPACQYVRESLLSLFNSK
ncbi:MAG: hypothetical protein COV52_05290 [Gammaproteobacteria bacterium CG11_big_fil_rev_8_21_14_0_20_46_22]|nr:MAG: hypothetical protein COW05_09965 [Gammaproteobacteria bacterium CG12_big_fil_rev_8_21_14_0_65_46_12]PIR11211.1 MAG: hypothetical protein COV52_05290 [Gammaproteobacteria bacterium CG11_big_fil_rev_8_21_14_0_20_46_22]